ncbi:MAG: tetratricopeptide repeat protein [Pyrinomonadaceae bacterium]
MVSYIKLLAILILGFGAIYLSGLRLENLKPQMNKGFADEDLYFSADQLNLIGSDFKGLIADWYWINSLQYMGNKLLNTEGDVNINNLRPLNPRLLYPMLDTAATLDPQFVTVYSYGAAILPAIDRDQAIKLLEKGIAANPENWRLYHNLGYIYWQQKNYSKAAELYAEGSKKNGAPVWMRQMSASMQAQGGSREFAKQVYSQMFESADDEQTKSFAELRYAQVQSLDERDVILKVLENFRQKHNRCAASWAEIFKDLRNVSLPDKTSLNFDKDGTPIDPTAAPYILENESGKCSVNLSKDSKVPPV